jgi:hypothetical protein
MKQSVTNEEIVRCIIDDLERFDMWSWRRTEISWTDRIKNEEILQKSKEKGNIVHTIKGRNADWIGHILRRNCLLKHIFEVKIEGTGRRGRGHKQLPDDLKEK